jgi:SAM-dependent methyltransferase
MQRDKVVAVAKGLATYVPFAYRIFGQRQMSDSVTADYGYHVWLKHLVLANSSAALGVPKSVLELGPGDTRGTGIAALLSGTESYTGVDARPFARMTTSVAVRNVTIAGGLAQKFRKKSDVKATGWPDFRSHLDEAGFPSRLLDDALLTRALEASRVARIMDSVGKFAAGGDDRQISYHAPLRNSSDVAPASIDFIFSHAVLPHIADLETVMAQAYRWLRPGGIMSHQFGQDSCGITAAWDGHRAFSERTWRVIVGARPFLLNRLPASSILKILERTGFQLLKVERNFREPTLSRRDLSPVWRDLPDQELRTAGAMIHAIKPV